MEEEDFKIIEYKNRTFKCFRDGRCFILFRNHHWRECLAKNHNYYRVHIGGEVGIEVHRLLGYAFLGLDIQDSNQHIDHINGNGLDNSFENIRVVDNQTNSRNNHFVTGVSKHKDGGFQAYIGKKENRQTKYFKTEEEALNWRKEKEIELGYLTRAKGLNHE